MRTVVALSWIVAGFALQGVSYFLLGAQLGVPASPAFSNPRVPFAPLLFVLGVVLVFLTAVVYELLPEKEEREEEEATAGDTGPPPA